MLDRERFAPAVLLGAGALIVLWYLLLLYRFPYALPYRVEEELIAVLGILYVAIFAAIVSSLAIFAVRLLKHAKSTKIADDSDYGGALTGHYFSHIRRLILFSILVAWTNILRNADDDSVIFFLVATIPVFVLGSALSNLVIEKTGTLESRGWSVEGWLAALVTLTTIVGLATNTLELSQTTWETIKFTFYAATTSPEEAQQIVPMVMPTVLAVAILWLMVLYYVVVLYKRWRALIDDCRDLFRKVAALYANAAR